VGDEFNSGGGDGYIEDYLQATEDQVAFVLNRKNVPCY
jgi:hypothetical protein